MCSTPFCSAALWGASPWIRGALRLGATQLLPMSGIPSHAAVNTAVELAARHGHRGTAGLVNAVLRRVIQDGKAIWNSIGTAGNDPAACSGEAEAVSKTDDPEDRLRLLSIRESHPSWLVRRWVRHWGFERTERVLCWNQQHPDYWLRLKPGESPPPGAVLGWIPQTARLKAGSRPAEAPGFAEGRWTIQDGSGILVGWLVPGARGLVIDLCAAPGTKTGHLLERAEAGARVVALDLSPGRLRRLRHGLGRTSGEPLCAAADGRHPPVRPPWDGVLIDAPCSNLGVLRRRVDLKWRAAEEEIPRLASIQAALLDAAAEGVMPGGWLTYSVCTLEPEETTAQRDRFLAAHPGWIPGALPEFLPAAARSREGEMILVPGELETDGTYAFVLRRESAR